MRIIYAYELDAADINSQSGYPFSILQQLERYGAEVIRVYPLRHHVQYLFAPKYLYHRRRGRMYRPDREPAFLRSIARQVERRVRNISADVVVETVRPGSGAYRCGIRS